MLTKAVKKVLTPKRKNGNMSNKTIQRLLNEYSSKNHVYSLGKEVRRVSGQNIQSEMYVVYSDSIHILNKLKAFFGTGVNKKENVQIDNDLPGCFLVYRNSTKDEQDDYVKAKLSLLLKDAVDKSIETKKAMERAKAFAEQNYDITNSEINEDVESDFELPRP